MIRTTHLFALIAFASALGWFATACSNDVTDDASGRTGIAQGAMLRGRIDDDHGNQHTTPALGSMIGASGGASVTGQATVASVLGIAADGTTRVLAEADVRADGTFSVEGLVPFEGIVVVEALTEGQGDVVGKVLVVHGLSDGAVLTVMPVSAETTAEAEAFLGIVADGVAAADIDAIGLITEISAESASAVTTGVELSGSVLTAQQARLEALQRASGSAVTAAEWQAAKSAAFEDLTLDLDAAASAEAEFEAWIRFLGRVGGELQEATGIAIRDQATAEAAASFAFGAHVSASAGTGAISDLTVATGAVLTAAAEHEAMIAAAAASGVKNEVEARVNGAFARFLASVRAATTVQAVADAKAELDAEISGRGGASKSALEILLTADTSGSAAVTASLNAALDAALAAKIMLAAELDAAIKAQTAALAKASASAFVRYRQSLETAIRGAASLLSDTSLDFLIEATASQDGGSSSVIEIAVMQGLPFQIIGSVEAGLGAQAGATALAAGLGTDFAGVTQARVSVFDEHGALTLVQTSSVDIAGGTFSIDRVDGEPSAMALIEVLDAGGNVNGMIILDRLMGMGGELKIAPITQETTVEAQVLLEAMRRGVLATDIDRGQLMSMIDASVAAAATAEEEIPALTSSVLAAQATAAAALGTTEAKLAAASHSAVAELEAALAAGSESSASAHARFETALRARAKAVASVGTEAFAKARAQANAAFRAVLKATLANHGSILSAGVFARAQINSAIHQTAALKENMEVGGIEALLIADVDLALAALIDATASATSATDIAAAGDAFRGSLLGKGTVTVEQGGVLDAILGAEAAIEAAIAPAVEASFTMATSAAADFRATVEAAARAAVDAQGRVDRAEVARATFAAWTTFEATVAASAEMAAVEDIGGAHASLASETILQTAGSLYGAL